MEVWLEEALQRRRRSLGDSGQTSRYRGDGVDGVHDGEQQDVVDAPGVVGVSGPGDLLAGGVVDEGRVSSDVHLVVCSVGDGRGRAVHVFILHQRLALLRHHHHEAEEQRRESAPDASAGPETKAAAALPDRSKLLQRVHQVGLGDTVHQTPDVHHHRGEGLMRVLIALEEGGGQQSAGLSAEHHQSSSSCLTGLGLQQTSVLIVSVLIICPSNSPSVPGLLWTCPLTSFKFKSTNQ